MPKASERDRERDKKKRRERERQDSAALASTDPGSIRKVTQEKIPALSENQP